MYITLFVDVEDCSTPLSDDIAKDIADILSDHRLTGNMMMVGDKARVLERRGRQDVIEALRRHEIGLHSDRHSRHPTVAEYLEDKGWRDGVEEAVNREGPGSATLQRVFGRPPTCWGQPGGSWGPQIHPAVKRLGIPVVVYPETYTSSSDVHWYGGTLTFGYRHVFGGFDTFYSDDGRFQRHFDAFRAKVDEYLLLGLPWMGLFLGHPIYVRAYEFGDVLNLGYGVETEPESWQQPPIKSDAEYRTALKNLVALVEYVAAHPRLQVATVGTLAEEFGRRVERIDREDLQDYAATACARNDILTDDPRLSPAEAVDVLVRAILAYVDGIEPGSFFWRHIDGPIAMPMRNRSETRVSWSAFCAGCTWIKSFIDRTGHLPAEVGLDDVRVGIGSFYRAVCKSFDILGNQHPPTEVAFLPGSQVPAIAESIAQKTERGYRGWVIHKPNLDATNLLQLTRLQTWTLKPTTLSDRNGGHFP